MDIITYALSKKGIINVDGKQYKPELENGNIVYKKVEEPGEYTTFTVGEAGVAGELRVISASTNPITELYINNVVQELPIVGDPKSISGTKYPVNEGDIVKIKGGFSLKETTLTINNIILQNNLTDCSNMFYYCTKLKEAPVIPNSVTNCNDMFYMCRSLTKAPVIPNSVTNCSYMFFMCTSLTEAPVIPNSVTNCSYMFSNCTGLTKAPVIPNSVTNCSYMFILCTSLTEAPVIPNSVTDCGYMFEECISLTEAPVIPNSVTDCRYMFSTCENLTTLPSENVDLMYNHNDELEHKFCYSGCANIINPITIDDIPVEWGGNKVEEPEVPTGEYTTFTVGEAGELRVISRSTNPITELYTNNVARVLPIVGDPKSISGTTYEVDEGDVIKIKGGFSLKGTMLAINNIILQNNLTDCSYMFTMCTKLKEAPVIPNSVTNCSNMFYNCVNLVEAPIIPEGVTDCSSMFGSCTGLTAAPEIPSTVTNCSFMFTMTGITEAPVIPNSVTDCSFMFYGCSGLIEAPIIPSSVTNCNCMFSFCTRLTILPPENVALLNNHSNELSFMGCYNSCTKIIDPISYDEIPNGWK